MKTSRISIKGPFKSYAPVDDQRKSSNYGARMAEGKKAKGKKGGGTMKKKVAKA